MALGQNRTWAKLVGGEHSHLWAIPAPLCSSKMIYSTKVDKLSTMWVEIRC